MTRRSCAHVLLYVPGTNILTSFHGLSHSHQLYIVWHCPCHENKIFYTGSWDISALVIASYGLEDWEVTIEFLAAAADCPDQFWGNANLFLSGYGVQFPGDKAAIWHLLSVVFATVPSFVLSSMWWVFHSCEDWTGYVLSIPWLQMCLFFSAQTSHRFVNSPLYPTVPRVKSWSREQMSWLRSCMVFLTSSRPQIRPWLFPYLFRFIIHQWACNLTPCNQHC
jgi:hypothetical protein